MIAMKETQLITIDNNTNKKIIMMTKNTKILFLFLLLFLRQPRWVFFIRTQRTVYCINQLIDQK